MKSQHHPDRVRLRRRLNQEAMGKLEMEARTKMNKKTMAMTAPLFKPEMFKPYAEVAKYGHEYSAEGKAAFARSLAAFALEGFAEKNFSKALYKRLSLTFHHIAHYNQGGFYDYWFAGAKKQLNWITYILSLEGTMGGDPLYTHSDVEQAFIKWLKGSGLEQQYATIVRGYEEQQEKAELARLKAKYESHP